MRSESSQISTDTTDDMTDDELALLGPPWAKEGLLSRKLYWESAGKRSQKKDWKQFFVVIQKGELHMFVFGETNAASSGTFGGGNWMVCSCYAKLTPEQCQTHGRVQSDACHGGRSAPPWVFPS